MQSIGQTLREARMRQGIDIREVETATKIRAKYLRALENEEFDLLPGPTLIRTFMRTYARHLGLDEQLLVEEYRARHEARSETEMQSFAPQTRPRSDRRDRRPPGRGTVALGLVGALLVFILVLGLTGDEGGDEPVGREPEAPARTEDPPDRRPERDRNRPAARFVNLRVIPTEETYVCVDDGSDRVLFEGTLAEPRAFRRRQLRINLGKRSVRLRVNGDPVRIEASADSAGFDFQAGEPPRELPEAERPCV